MKASVPFFLACLVGNSFALPTSPNSDDKEASLNLRRNANNLNAFIHYRRQLGIAAQDEQVVGDVLSRFLAGGSMDKRDESQALAGLLGVVQKRADGQTSGGIADKRSTIENLPVLSALIHGALTGVVKRDDAQLSEGGFLNLALQAMAKGGVEADVHENADGRKASNEGLASRGLLDSLPVASSAGGLLGNLPVVGEVAKRASASATDLPFCDTEDQLVSLLGQVGLSVDEAQFLLTLLDDVVSTANDVAGGLFGSTAGHSASGIKGGARLGGNGIPISPSSGGVVIGGSKTNATESAKGGSSISSDQLSSIFADISKKAGGPGGKVGTFFANLLGHFTSSKGTGTDDINGVAGSLGGLGKLNGTAGLNRTADGLTGKAGELTGVVNGGKTYNAAGLFAALLKLAQSSGSLSSVGGVNGLSDMITGPAGEAAEILQDQLSGIVGDGKSVGFGSLVSSVIHTFEDTSCAAATTVEDGNPDLCNALTEGINGITDGAIGAVDGFFDCISHQFSSDLLSARASTSPVDGIIDGIIGCVATGIDVGSHDAADGFTNGAPGKVEGGAGTMVVPVAINTTTKDVAIPKHGATTSSSSSSKATTSSFSSSKVNSANSHPTDPPFKIPASAGISLDADARAKAGKQ